MCDDVQLREELASIKKAGKADFRRIKRLHAKRNSDEDQYSRETSQVDHGVSITNAAISTTSDPDISQEASYRESELAA
jgi:hypothetical protein